MEWSSEYSVGNPEIDKQHRDLALLISALEKSVSTKQDRERMHADLVMLAKYNRAHFAVEENLMLAHAYPASEAHLAEHRQFAAALADLERKSATQNVSSGLVALIRAWEEQHVMVSDKHLARYIGSSEAGGDAGPWSMKSRWADSEDADLE